MSAHSCSHILGNGQPCSLRGTLQFDGRWYCGHHHPEKIRQRAEARDAKQQNAIWKRATSVNLKGAPSPTTLTALKMQELGLAHISCAQCQQESLKELSRLLDALTPFERDGKIAIPGLDTLQPTRNILARAKAGLLAQDVCANAPQCRQAA